MLKFLLFFFPKIRKFCQNFAEFSPNLTKFFRDFSKMQHFSKKFERVGASPKFLRSFSKFPRSFPDVLQFGGQPTPPTKRPFLAHAAPVGLIKPAALRDDSREAGTASK